MTMHEADKVTQRMIKGKAITVNGVANLVFSVPSGGRVLSGGQGWFLTPHPEDYVEVYVILPDGTVVGGYTDTEGVPGACGYWIPKHSPIIEVKSFLGFGDIPEGLCLLIKATKGDLSSDMFYANIVWGKHDG